MICQNCGSQIADGLNFCTECGKPIVSQSVSSEPSKNEVDEYFKKLNYEKEYAKEASVSRSESIDKQRKKAEASATSSIVMGALGFFMSALIIPGLILGIISIVKAVNSKKAGYKGKSGTIGLILGILSTLIGVLMFILTIYYTVTG